MSNELKNLRRAIEFMEERENHLQTALDAANAEVGLLREVFGHTHRGPGDACKQCGLDIRDNIHAGIAPPAEHRIGEED